MKNERAYFTYIRMCSLLLGLCGCFLAHAQKNIVVNMAAIDGLPIVPDNILSYQLYASESGRVEVRGSIRYRGSDINLSYRFFTNVSQGMNQPDVNVVQPQWQFSTPGLQELFSRHKALPSGTFEYCVTVTPVNAANESAGAAFEECIFHHSDESFLINLVEPVNKAKLQELNPLLTWAANYSFSNELTYRLRVAEIKKGQNPVNAIMRNQPMYDEKDLLRNSQVYPLFAKPLMVNQRYAWTVDAYYKGLLLGGAETWEFIIPDSVPVPVKSTRSYIDIKRESGLNMLYAVGTLKLKYVLDDAAADSLYLEITDGKKKTHPLKPQRLAAAYGDNRYDIDLAETSNLKHESTYTMVITTKLRRKYTLTFQYLNPEYQHN